MPSPFPGMDPYLESVELWTAVHHALLSAMADQLAPVLRPKYTVRTEERVYLEDEDELRADEPTRRFPDVGVVANPGRHRSRSQPGGAAIAEPVQAIDLFEQEVVEHALAIRSPADGALVTAIEVLSPSNKRVGGQGRASLLDKRREAYQGQVHWMEVDLLRAGARTTHPVPPVDAEYYVFLSRLMAAPAERQACYWPMPLRDRLPVIGVPLRGGDEDVPLDLQVAMDYVHLRGSYDLTLPYDADPPRPRLMPDDAAWCRDRVAAWQAAGS